MRSALRPVPVPTVPVRPDRERLHAIATILDAATHDWSTGVLVHVSVDGDELELGLRELDPTLHPSIELAAVVAEPAWWALCLVTHGRAHLLDAPDAPPEPIVSTYAVDRAGHEVSLLRRGTDVEELTGPVVGRIPDLLRHILGAPPAPWP